MIASDRCDDVAFQDKIKREFLCCAHPRRGQCLRRRNQRHDHQEVHQKVIGEQICAAQRYYNRDNLTRLLQQTTSLNTPVERAHTRYREGLPLALIIEAIDESTLVELTDKVVIVEIFRFVPAHLMGVINFHDLLDPVD